MKGSFFVETFFGAGIEIGSNAASPVTLDRFGGDFSVFQETLSEV